MIEQWGNYWTTVEEWNEFFDHLEKKPSLYVTLGDYGIFSFINLFYNITEKTELEADLLDYNLYAHCGERLPAPILTIPEEINATTLQKIGKIIAKTYAIKWDRLSAINQLDYNPLLPVYEEYTEETTSHQVDDIDVAKATTNSLVNSGNDTTLTTNNLTNTSQNQGTTQGTSTSHDDVYGFNSDTAVPSDAGGSSNSQTTSYSDTLTRTGTITEQLTHGKRSTNTSSGSEGFDSESSGASTREYTRTGNIGNMSNQHLISEEIALRRWNFVTQVMEDVKDILTIPVYDY